MWFLFKLKVNLITALFYVYAEILIYADFWGQAVGLLFGFSCNSLPRFFSGLGSKSHFHGGNGSVWTKPHI